MYEAINRRLGFFFFFTHTKEGQFLICTYCTKACGISVFRELYGATALFFRVGNSTAKNGESMFLFHPLPRRKKKCFLNDGFSPFSLFSVGIFFCKDVSTNVIGTYVFVIKMPYKRDITIRYVYFCTPLSSFHALSIIEFQAHGCKQVRSQRCYNTSDFV